jgi:hypothetical protein
VQMMMVYALSTVNLSKREDSGCTVSPHNHSNNDTAHHHGYFRGTSNSFLSLISSTVFEFVLALPRGTLQT